jgi:hypothetical protein
MSDTEFKGHRGDVVGIAISPDGSKAVSGAHVAQFSDDAIVGIGLPALSNGGWMVTRLECSALLTAQTGR